MTTDVKFFAADMQGAPQISGTKGSLLGVIDACLVSGFGLKSANTVTVADGVATVVLTSGNFVQHQVVLVEGATPAGLNGEKRVLALTGASSFTFDATGIADGVATGSITVRVAPLGWIKAFSGVNTGAYKIDPVRHPDTTGCLVRIADTGNYCASVNGFESMTGIDTGVAPFPLTPTWWFRSDAAHPSTAARHWYVVGDSRFVYVGVHAYTNSAVDSGNIWAAFGEFVSKKLADPFRFVVSGCYSADVAATSNFSESDNSCAATDTSHLHLVRSYTGLGGSVSATTRTWPSSYGASGGGPMSYPNGPDYGLYLCPAQLFESSHYRGDWPGMRFIPQNVQRQICPNVNTTYFDTQVAGYEGKLVGFFPCAYFGLNWGVVAFDLTGPWEH